MKPRPTNIFHKNQTEKRNIHFKTAEKQQNF